MKSLRKTRTQVLLASAAVVLAVSVATLAIVTRESAPRREPEIKLRRVSVQRVIPEPHAAQILVHATLAPRWQTALSAEVTGRVISVSPKLLSGRRFRSGEVLVQVDPTDYEARLAAAEGELANAVLAVEEAQALADQAERDWERGGQPGVAPSRLTLRRPQLEAAEATRRAAEAGVRQARTDLERTSVRAPYDGVVLSRGISIGDLVSPGVEVATVYASGVLEARLPVPEKELALLPANALAGDLLDLPVELQPVAQPGVVWPARIRRAERVVDEQHRWRHLVAVLDLAGLEGPAPVPGEFVQARFLGRDLPGLLRLPESSLGRRGNIWTVDPAGLLRSHPARVAFKQDGELFIEAPQAPHPLDVVLHPVASFDEGQRVAPVRVDEVNDEH